MKNPTIEVLAVQAENIPCDLTDREKWVVWKLEYKKGKPTKLPYNVATGRLASSTDPKTWSTFGAALEAYRRPNSGFAGIGFVFSADDPFVGVDLDHCVGEHGLSTWLGAQLKAWPDDPPEPFEIVESLASYAELSPSGTGVKIFCKGKLSEGRRKTGDFELYDEKRYFTVTGHRLDGAPTAVLNGGGLAGVYRSFFAATAKPAAKKRATSASPMTGNDEEIVRRIIASKSGLKFLGLWAGNTDGYPSKSEADMALAGLLRFWTQDATQIERLMRSSGLVREKWDANRDYLARTIAHVVDAGGETFSWRSAGDVVVCPTAQSPFLELPRRELPRDVEHATPAMETPTNAIATTVGLPRDFTPLNDEQRLWAINQLLVGRGGRGLTVIGVEKLGASGGVFQLILDGGEKIEIGTARDLLSVAAVRTAVFDQAGVLIPMSKTQWHIAALAISDLAVVRVFENEGDDIRHWLDDFVEECRRFWAGGEATEGSAAWRDEKYPQMGRRHSAGVLFEGRTMYLHFDSFAFHVTDHDRGIGRGAIKQALVAAGFESGHRLKRKGSRIRVWRHPEWERN